MDNITIPIFDDEFIVSMPDATTENESEKTTESVYVDMEDDDDEIVVDKKVETTEEPVEEDTNDYGENADPKAVIVFDQLVEEGVFDDEDKKSFDGSWEKVREGLTNLPQKVLNGLVAQAPDIAKDVVRFAFSSPNITREDLVKFNETYLEETKPIEVELETMDDARSYLESKYTARGDKPRAITAALDALEEDGLLLDEAKEQFEKDKDSRKDRPKTEQLITDKLNEENARVQQQTQFAATINEELNATGWKPVKINEIKQRLSSLNPLLVEAFKSPKALIKLTDFLGYYKNGDIDYSKFITSIESPKAEQFATRMQNAIDSPTLSTKSNLKNQKGQDNLKPIFD